MSTGDDDTLEDDWAEATKEADIEFFDDEKKQEAKSINMHITNKKVTQIDISMKQPLTTIVK